MSAGARRAASFGLIADDRTRLLILGTLPGAKSLEAGEYYANPRNGFWSLLGTVVGLDLRALPYRARLDTLMSRGIGLWDVIADAERQGSLDSAIRNARLRDVASTAASLPSLQAIAFNGGKAAKIGRSQLGACADRYDLLTLLSSSGACAVRGEVKRSDWSRLTSYLC